MSHAQLRDLLAASLRNDSASVAALRAVPVAEVIAAADREGVTPLLAEALATHGADDLGAAFVAESARLSVQEALREPELRRALASLASSNVPALLFKGAELAYLCYQRPELRPRLDSDLLVRSADRGAARQVLLSLGYELVLQFEGARVTHQCTFVKRRGPLVLHVVDLHWRVANPQEFGRLLDWDDVAAESISIPALGETAIGFGVAHALFTSIVHPVAHHQNTVRLLWDLDTARLASRMREIDWERFLRLASATSVLVAVSAVRLQRAMQLFGARVPDDVLSQLLRDSRAADRQRMANFDQPARQIASVLSSLRAFPSWKDRVQFVREHAFPPATYMRGVYAPDSRAPLAVLYARRAFFGARRWIARPGQVE